MDDLNAGLTLLVGRMDAKLDILLTRSDSHEVRIGNLEAASNVLKGGSKTGIWVLGGVGALIVTLLPITMHYLGLS